MKKNRGRRLNEITVIAQTSIELFPVVTCSKRHCHEGYPSMQPSLIVNGYERYYMHHLGPQCPDCDKFHEVWKLNLQALA